MKEEEYSTESVVFRRRVVLATQMDNVMRSSSSKRAMEHWGMWWETTRSTSQTLCSGHSVSREYTSCA